MRSRASKFLKHPSGNSIVSPTPSSSIPLSLSLTLSLNLQIFTGGR